MQEITQMPGNLELSRTRQNRLRLQHIDRNKGGTSDR